MPGKSLLPPKRSRSTLKDGTSEGTLLGEPKGDVAIQSISTINPLTPSLVEPFYQEKPFLIFVRIATN
jgi:hypothetical protein